MKLLDLFLMSLSSLQRNRTRTMLTILGIFMGVLAVNATLQIRSTSNTKIVQRLSEREAPHLRVWTAYSTLEDLEYLKKELDGIQAVSAVIRDRSAKKAIYRDREINMVLLAISEEYFVTTGRRIIPDLGRNLLPDDFKNYRNSIVIDESGKERLFGRENPIKEVIYLNGIPYRVVGVMESKASQYDPESLRAEFVIPISTYMALNSQREVNTFFIRPYRIDQIEQLEEEIKILFQQKYQELKNESFRLYVYNNVGDILEDQKIARLATNSLFAAGIISLIVAGVGIANITIASMLERTPELGLRRAIGAQKKQILLQILIEAVIVSTLGGCSAIAMVNGVTFFLTQQEKLELPTYQFNIENILISFSAAIATGVGSSLIPAIRASQIEPVTALRDN